MTPGMRRWVGPITVAIYAIAGWALYLEGWQVVGPALVGMAVLRALLWLRSMRQAPEED